ncbi:GntR family transcriptional regulator [Mycolicibacterium confluentis]|uniref:GntR family transcriptional regulator n=1 Tax=Mycolicibacterium confluentis TaxID=28047 RepID=A0A7I7XS47_9MYCO|nr:GntR family transcriptional regulator [Mycolicibacterium confluentis]MCV7321420.1 GntR family transcriptional regulator [Mycolicibacterium confluentis]ORV33042.1 GntR family transcriptional regulator [Mycolicibacterium confluentis]BBZ32096.1 GntR family transcriptional regulator [Mycolicibacterium confluentis]
MTRGDGRRPAPTTAAGVPLHRQLFLVLHDEIERGAIPAGDPLPTEQELCEQFGVSRITVRRALSDLADQGYITRKQGVGSFVREFGPRAGQASTRSYMDELRQVHFETDAEVVDCTVGDVPHLVAGRLGVTGQMLHTLRVRRERRTGEALIVTEAWLPAELAGTITADRLAHTAMYELLAEVGLVVQRVQHEITAEIAGPRNAGLLDLAIGAPVLRVNRLAFTGGEQPHHYLSILLSPSRSRIVLNHTSEELMRADTMAMLHDVRPEN